MVVCAAVAVHTGHCDFYTLNTWGIRIQVAGGVGRVADGLDEMWIGAILDVGGFDGGNGTDGGGQAESMEGVMTGLEVVGGDGKGEGEDGQGEEGLGMHGCKEGLERAKKC